mmetsp:Transcript_78052/g.203365  ORF Transcript_78052/g.203365 Transcript_78052/m.203365 type:complete len:178 (-) Transcript_78052:437-970(-)
MSSSWEPRSTILPSATTRMTWQCWIVDRRCAMEKDVLPRCAFSSAADTTFSLWLSRALVASSSRRTGGSLTMARQIATRCFWPPDSLWPRGPTCVSQPFAVWLSKNVRLHICLHSSRRCSETFSPSSSPYLTFSSTLVSKRMGSWPTKPTCLLHHLMFSVSSGARSAPTSTFPACGS